MPHSLVPLPVYSVLYRVPVATVLVFSVDFVGDCDLGMIESMVQCVWGGGVVNFMFCTWKLLLSIT